MTGDTGVAQDELPAEDKPQVAAEKEAKVQPGRSLFVRALAKTVTSETLAELFSESYPIKHATAVLDPATKECRGYGFVTFADADDAQRAKQEYDGKKLDGRKIRVELAEARDRADKTGAVSEAKAKRELVKSQEREAPRLIVRNLPWSIKKDEQLAALFSKYGKVKQAYLPKRSGGLLPGFGFVAMRSKKHAEKAIAGENGKSLDGRTIAVDWAVEKEVYQRLQREEVTEVEEEEDSSSAHDEAAGGANEENSSDVDESDTEQDIEDDEDKSDLEANKLEDRSATLFIRNLPFSCSDDDLEEHFTAFGSVRYARIVLDQVTEQPRGCGFVAFRSKQDAESCLRGAPTRPSFPHPSDQKKGTPHQQSSSILQNPDADPSGKYTMEGRVLHLSRAVDKTEAKRLTEEATANRTNRNNDKRRLYLLAEGTIPSNSKLWQSLAPSERTMREASLKQRKTLIEKNPSLHFSFTRLSVRNIPRSVGSKELKALARQAVVGFAKDVKEGKRQKLSEEELIRGGDTMRAADHSRKEAGKGVVKQAKVVFEGEGGSKVDEASGAGRSRGYGFIEYHTHRNALMGLRWLNGHSIGYQVKDPKAELDREALQDRKKRLIVEFAIENAQVVHRRAEREEKSRDKTVIAPKGNTSAAKLVNPSNAKNGVNRTGDAAGSRTAQKRKRGHQDTVAVSAPVKDAQQSVDDEAAQRNRIIGRKRAVRRENRSKK